MIEVALDDKWRVRLKTEFVIPATRNSVWEIISDFRRMVCTDHFHKHVEFTVGSGEVGSQFTIHHRFWGFGVTRMGRILKWQDGFGYWYSDLNQTNPQSTFPHVFFIELVDAGMMDCIVRVGVNGRWTTPHIGRLLTRSWLYWNLVAIRRGVENAILRSLA